MADCIRRYPSAVAYVASCVTKDGQPIGHRESRDASQKEARDEWDDSLGWDGAVRACRIGHSGYAHKVANTIERIRALLPDLNQPGRAWDAYPSTPEWSLDIATHLAGDPEPFVTYPPQRPSAPIRILVGGSASARVEAEVIIRRGAALCAVRDVLHERGVEVELSIAAYAARYDDGDLLATFPLAAEAHAVAWWVAHPAAYRRTAFAWLETHAPTATHDGYGRPMYREQFVKLNPGYDHYLEPVFADDHQCDWFATEESSAKHAADLIETLFQRATANT